MQLYLIVLLLMGVYNRAVAQNNPYKIDDRIFPTYNQATTQVQDPAVLLLGDTVLQLSKLYNDKKAEVLAYTIPLNHYTRIKDWENTHKSADAVRKIARQNQYMQYYYFAYSQEGTLLLNLGRNAEAINLLGRMRAEATAEHNSYGMYTSYIGLGNVYHVLYNYTAAEELYVMAAELTEKELPDQLPSRAWLNAATVAVKNEDYNKALTYLEKAIATNDIAAGARTTSSSYAYQAFCHYMVGELDKARHDCEEYAKLQIEGRTIDSYKPLVSCVNALLEQQYEMALERSNSISDSSEKSLVMQECYRRLGKYADA